MFRLHWAIDWQYSCAVSGAKNSVQWSPEIEQNLNQNEEIWEHSWQILFSFPTGGNQSNAGDFVTEAKFILVVT